MRTLYIILKPLMNTETKSLKVVEALDSKLDILLDTYIDKGEEVKNFTQKELESYVANNIDLSGGVEFFYL